MSTSPALETGFKSSDIAVLFSVCFFFTLEAILHYSIGKTGGFAVVLPPMKDFVKIVTIVLVFSVLSTITQRIILNVLGEESE